MELDLFDKRARLKNVTSPFGGWWLQPAGTLHRTNLGPSPMLPPFIIEQIRRREQQERAQREAQRPRVELPISPFVPEREGFPASRPWSEEDGQERDRGVTIIQF